MAFLDRDAHFASLDFLRRQIGAGQKIAVPLIKPRQALRRRAQFSHAQFAAGQVLQQRRQRRRVKGGIAAETEAGDAQPRPLSGSTTSGLDGALSSSSGAMDGANCGRVDSMSRSDWPASGNCANAGALQARASSR